MLLTIIWACQRILIMVIFFVAGYQIGWYHGTFEAWAGMKGFKDRRFRAARKRVDRLESDLLMDSLREAQSRVNVD